MKTQIETKITQWQAGTAQLHEKRQQLLADLERVNSQIQMNQGAILGAQELLRDITQPAAAPEVEAPEPA